MVRFGSGTVWVQYGTGPAKYRLKDFRKTTQKLILLANLFAFLRSLSQICILLITVL